MDDLENYFPGSEAWSAFAALATVNDLPDETARMLSVDFGKHWDVAAVAWHDHGSGYRRWLDESIPALSGATPRECLRTERGVKRLKTMLMRMHR